MDNVKPSLLAAIENQEKLADSSGLDEAREDAIDRYLGRPYGNEQPGRSQVVSRDIADTIEWIKPSLMKVFASGDEVVRFDPRGPEDEQQAQQETEYVNYLINQRNNGFVIFHDWFHDALLSKTGYVLVQAETKKTSEVEQYGPLTDDEFALLMQAPDLEVQEHSEEKTPLGMTHRVAVRKVGESVKIAIRNVAPERVRIAADWPDLDLQGCPFVSITEWMTISDLRQQGYDVDDNISDTAASYDEGSEQARSIEDVIYDADRDSLGADPATRRVRVRYVWIRYDDDGDGIAELRRVVVVGATILENEEDDIVPIASICPVRQPHEHYGLSIADVVDDLQRIKTALIRNFIDSRNLSTHGRFAIDANLVNVDDLLVSRPGGVVRVKGPPGMAITPLVAPDTGQQAIQAIEYIDSVRENRTGVTRYNQGLDANSLNKTASGITQIMTASQARIEQIARLFAESGVKALMWIVHAMSIKHTRQAELIRLQGQWVPVDPRGWKRREDMTVSVGLGTGNKDQMLQHLMLILQAQKEGMAIGLATPKNIYNALARLTQNAGFKQVEEFWSDPQQNPQQPQPHPDVVKAQMQTQADMQKTQMQTQADAQKFQAQQQIEGLKLQFEAQQAELDRAHKERLAQMSEATKLEIARMQQEHSSQLEMMREQSRKQPVAAEVDVTGVRDLVSAGNESTAEMLKSLQATMQVLADAMSRPKQVVRDKAGKVIGVQ